jgi:predicted secreted protein with PEFG-CTERM motif
MVPVMEPSLEQTQITLNTDKDSYGPGDLVSITGTISGATNQYVAIQVKDPSGNLIAIRTVQTDSNGNFALQFKVPTTATPGNFEIDANAKVNGQVVTATKSILQTVPEFGTVARLIVLISIIGVIVISRTFMKSKSQNNDFSSAP